MKETREGRGLLEHGYGQSRKAGSIPGNSASGELQDANYEAGKITTLPPRKTQTNQADN